MSIYNWGFNNSYIGMNPFMGGCYCSPMCNTGFLGYTTPSLFMPPYLNNYLISSSPGANLFGPVFNNNGPYLGFNSQGINWSSILNSNTMFSGMTNPFGMFGGFSGGSFAMPSMFSFSSMPVLPSIPTFSAFPSFSTGMSNPFASTSNTNVQTSIDSGFSNTAKLDKKFLAKVKQVAKNVNCNYKDLLAVMNAESGLQPNKWNGRSAVGLIQFTNTGLAGLNKTYGLNLTKNQIAKMSAMDQLDLVEKFIKMNKKTYMSENAKLSNADLYSLIFLPARSGSEVLCRSGENYYAQNKGLDKNKDGQITKTELAQQISNKYVNESIFA